MAITLAFDDTALDRIFPAGTYYASLHTSSPSPSGSAGEISTSGTGYARQAMTFAASSGGTKANSTQLTFGPSTSSWGTITHVGIWDASSGGTLLAYGALTSSVSVGSGASAVVSAGAVAAAIT